MKRLVRYKLNFHSRFLTLSGVMMGFAFFLQALEFFALRQLQSVNPWELWLVLILPMAIETLWCLPLRTESWNRAEAHGIFAALFCAVLLGQTILSGGVFPIIMGSIFFLVSGVAAVLITWGFIAHRALGFLVFSAAAVVRVLIFALPSYISAPGYMTLLQQAPAVFVILGMMFFFGGIHMRDDE